jgi:hypothetical protein
MAVLETKSPSQEGRKRLPRNNKDDGKKNYWDERFPEEE